MYIAILVYSADSRPHITTVLRRTIPRTTMMMDATTTGASADDGPSTPTQANTPGMDDVLSEFLGVALHELLYLRNIYPTETFSAFMYLGMQVHAVRHTELSNYIEEFIQVAAPSLSRGLADALCLVIVEEGSQETQEGQRNTREEDVLERYVFEFDSALAASVHNEWKSAPNKNILIGENGGVRSRLVGMEREFRNMILRIIGLGALFDADVLPPGATFRLCLRTTTRALSGSRSNRKNILRHNLNAGSWIQSQSESRPIEVQGCQQRPLKTLHLPTCGLQMTFSYGRRCTNNISAAEVNQLW